MNWQWQDDAACDETTAELFFQETQDTRPTREAKQICARCPVSHQCLMTAIRDREKHGIWGGLTYPERLQYVREQNLPNIRLLERRERVRQLNAEGLNDPEIAARLGVHEKNIWNDRTVIGIPVVRRYK